ncbi:MAG: prephenate dehydrogenase/arogenate dehydrogenase family protein [Chloroflexi bacterium]|nr:prephenate dehydrogenase/arogenate dehydrogenase family protein [Chloroflexota bacterium]
MAGNESSRRVAIIGLGLIGGSLGLAIKAARLDRLEVVGYDHDRGVAGKARKIGAVDHTASNLKRAVSEAGLVIIATPILAVREVLGEIAPHLAEGTIVTDTGSTKGSIMGWAQELLPPTVNFIGGHPMAGKETQGIDHAEATLFANKAYCLCPSINAGESAVGIMIGLAHLIGARPLFIDPAEHDQYVAAVSHLPLVLSTALFTLVRFSPGWEDIAPLAASGFHDLTRLTSGDPGMSHDICLTNREALTHWIDRLQAELRRYRELVSADGDQLFEAFARARLERDAFIASGPPARTAPPQRESVDMRDAFMSFFVGRAVLERVGRIGELGKAAAERTARELREAGESGEEKEGRAERMRLFRERTEAGLKRELEEREKDSPGGA